MAEQEVKMTEGVFTDELIEEMRQKVGVKLRIDNVIVNEEVTKRAMIRFADGIGDLNTLYRDEEYAKKTRYGKLTASPSFVVSVLGSQQFGWRGLAGFHSGSEFEFHKPILIGDKITPEEIYEGFEGPKPSKFAEKMVIDYVRNKYTNQRGELVSDVLLWIIRTERRRAREKGKYKQIQLPHPWTEEELMKVEEEVLAEEIRGSTPRYWEDVEVGEELKPVVKGPLGATDMVAMISGGIIPFKLGAHGVALREYRRKPAWAFRDPDSYALEPIFAVHYNKRAANAMGLPLCYDLGIQRHCWQITLLTNWIGDDGWLKRCRAEYRRFVYYSDVIWVKGKVTKKYFDENGEPCVDIETRGVNQREEELMPGDATVILPSREKGYWPLDKRLG
jgi:acyl dehydratase